jgi:hypothetical protein
MEPIGQIHFRNLLRKEMQELATHLTNNPTDINAYVRNLALDLGGMAANETVDDEHISIVALRHRNNFSRELLQEICKRLKALAPVSIGNLFETGALGALGIPSDMSQVAQAIKLTPSNYEATVRPLFMAAKRSIQTQPSSAWGHQVDRLAATHRSFVERSGDAELYVRTCGALANELLKTASRHGQIAVRKAESLVIDVLGTLQFCTLE